MQYRLLLFTRYPMAGKSKTRLLPAFSPWEAAQLQRSMTEITVAVVLALQQKIPMDIEIRFTGATSAQMVAWLGEERSHFRYVPQGEGDLGERLTAAFCDAFHSGMVRVLAICSDCPQLSIQELTEAVDLLAKADVVLGPAIDGGYYLLGMRKFYPELFSGISWSTSEVLKQTIEIACNRQLSVSKLALLADIDRPEDLTFWLQQKIGKTTPIKLSIIIPTRNEASTIGKTLTYLLNQPRLNPIEIIVVDGNSTDHTREIARSLGVIVLSTSAHRAQQMNLGAAQATGDILLFLHADTQLPAKYDSQIIVTLSKPRVIGGAFLLRIAAQDWRLRIVEWGANLRSRQGQLPYGDQGLFLLKSTFREIGGFPEIPIMEDFILVRQLQKKGKVEIVPDPILTSARRWQRLGIWQTTLINQLIVIGYFLGVSPDRLANWYQNRR